jgi:hypothetical protein
MKKTIKESNLRNLIKKELKQQLNEQQELNIMNLPEEEQIKIIAQYEAIRRSGQYNMFHFYEVQRAAYENKFYEFVNFTSNNTKAYASILKNYGELINKVKNIPQYKRLVVKLELEESTPRKGIRATSKQKLLKEDHGEEAFYDDDGWNEDAFGDIGLMEWIEKVERLAYELRSARRGAYALSGSNLKDVVSFLQKLQESLTDIIDYLESEIGT